MRISRYKWYKLIIKQFYSLLYIIPPAFGASNQIIYLTLILLRLFQQHYCYNVTGQSQESEGSCKPARIKEVHSKLHSFQASLCTLTATHLTLIYVCTYIRLSVPLGCLIKQAGIIIHTILNMWETPGIEPVTSDLTSVYQISSSIPPHCQVNPVPITAW